MLKQRNTFAILETKELFLQIEPILHALGHVLMLKLLPQLLSLHLVHKKKNIFFILGQKQTASATSLSIYLLPVFI